MTKDEQDLWKQVQAAATAAFIRQGYRAGSAAEAKHVADDSVRLYRKSRKGNL